MSDTAAANKEFMKGLYAAFTRGDIATVLNGVTEDSVWHIAAGPSYGGKDYRGPAELGNFFAAMGAAVTFTKFDVHFMMAEGDYVVAFIASEGKGNQNSVTASMPVVHRWRIQDGKIAEMWEVLDSREYVKMVGA